MSASRPAGTTPVAIFETARGTCPPYSFPAMSAPPGAPVASGGHHRVPVATSNPARRIYPAVRAPL